MAEPARKLLHREIANLNKEEKIKGMRRAFTLLLEPKELLKIVAPSAMAKGVKPSEFFEHINDLLGFQIRAVALGNAEWRARRIVAGLEESAEKTDTGVELVKLSKEEYMKIPCFTDFLYMCIIRKFLAIKAIDSGGMESPPVIFSPNMILFQHDGDSFMGIYDERTVFSDIFRGLEFR
jgi:hypothetical protein